MSHSEPQDLSTTPFSTNAIDAAYRCILPISALLYGIGLIIENIRAQSYGWSGSQLLQAQYVLAGLLWGSLTSFGLVAARAIGRLVRNRKQVWLGDGIKNQLARYSIILTGVGGIWALYYIMAGFLGVADVFAKLAVLGVILCQSLTVSALVMDTWNDMKSASKPEDPIIVKLRKTDAIQIMKRGLFCVAALSLYATIAYPQLSPALGGGMQRQAEIVIRKEQRNLFEHFPSIKIDSDGKITSVAIVGESNEFLVIAPVDKRWWKMPSTSMLLRKDSVQLVSYASQSGSQ